MNKVNQKFSVLISLETESENTLTEKYIQKALKRLIELGGFPGLDAEFDVTFIEANEKHGR